MQDGSLLLVPRFLVLVRREANAVFFTRPAEFVQPHAALSPEEKTNKHGLAV